MANDSGELLVLEINDGLAFVIQVILLHGDLALQLLQVALHAGR